MTLVLTLAILESRPTASPHPLPAAAHHAPAGGNTRAPASAELFSLRARRRFAAYLRMRLLELREEGLDRAAAAVERSIPVQELLNPRH